VSRKNIIEKKSAGKAGEVHSNRAHA